MRKKTPSSRPRKSAGKPRRLRKKRRKKKQRRKKKLQRAAIPALLTVARIAQAVPTAPLPPAVLRAAA